MTTYIETEQPIDTRIFQDMNTGEYWEYLSFKCLDNFGNFFKVCVRKLINDEQEFWGCDASLRIASNEAFYLSGFVGENEYKLLCRNS